MNIYVGNVPYAATEEDLEALFSEYGPVATATIIRDRYNGRSKGFGFVEMETQADGEKAIEELDGQEMMGRPLKVNPARPREQRRGRRQGHRIQNNPDQASESSPEKTQDSSPENKFFHNPYTFVPTPPRGHIKRGKFAGDFNPLKKNLNHSSLQPKLWTGYIPIKLRTVTPLVLPDAGGEERSSKEHQKYNVLDRIPESSLRGMLRSAYEVVTNSRYGRFSKNDPLRRNDRISPLELLDLSLHPASSMDTLSPADRLFGWVPSPMPINYSIDRDIDSSIERHMDRVKYLVENSPKDLTAHAYVYQSLQYLKGTEHGQSKFDELKKDSKVKEIHDRFEDREEGGYKGRIRVVCEDGARPEIIRRFEDGQHLPLTPLSAPKPTYGRFYVAKDSQGTPQDDGCLSKAASGYSEGKGLRGRKQYWHHNRLESVSAPDYWENPIEDRTQTPNKDGLYQEYRRPNEDDKPKTDAQNRSIRGWIKPGTEFKVTLHVQNLQKNEIGALLWLLTLNDEIGEGDEKYYFRLGYGKPLGFGSVEMEIDWERCEKKCLPLGTGKDWKENYYAGFRGIFTGYIERKTTSRI